MVRSTHLKQEYDKLLRSYGLTRRPSGSLGTTSDELRETLVAAGWNSVDIERALRLDARGDHGLDGIVEDIAFRIEKALGIAQISIPSSVYASEFPHGSFNAQACRVRGGTLILLNTGLMMFVHEAAKLAMRSVMTVERVNGEMKLVEGDDEIVNRVSSVIVGFGEIVYGYLFQSRIPQTPMPDPTRSMLSAFLTAATETFAVAHEYGHLVAGHLDTRPSERGRSGWIEKSRAEEMEADYIAALLLIRSGQEVAGEEHSEVDLRGLRDLIPRGPLDLPGMMVSPGPMFFFALDRLISQVKRGIGWPVPADPTVSEHPSSESRAGAIREVFEELSGFRSMQFADPLTVFVEQCERGVLEYVKNRREEESQGGDGPFGH